MKETSLLHSTPQPAHTNAWLEGGRDGVAREDLTGRALLRAPELVRLRQSAVARYKRTASGATTLLLHRMAQVCWVNVINEISPRGFCFTARGLWPRLGAWHTHTGL
eukprot:1542401-Prymnesium_polylepis.1